jgi:hypothetical protein
MEIEYTADTPIQLKESKVSFHDGLFGGFALLKLQSFYLNTENDMLFFN